MLDRLGKLILNIATEGTAAHAYIIEGKPGQYMDEFLDRLIKGIMCENLKSDGSACNECKSCRQLDARTCLDIVKMDKTGKTGYKAIDAVGFIQRINMGSYGKRIIGIISNADQLGETVENKLLKTLEEPMSDAIILLVATNASNLLSTVRSRCSLIRVSDYETFENEASILAQARTEQIKTEQVEYGDYENMKFYEFRVLVEKKIKTQEEALRFLGLMEDTFRNRMVKGEDIEHNAAATVLLEQARMDIYRGMSYGKALKRIYLELE